MSTPETPSVRPLRDRPAWTALERHYEALRGRHLRDLFAGDSGRGERLVAEGPGLFLDYSKNRITDETVELLGALAEQSGVPGRIAAMFAGEHINVSEDRAVLHVALRMPRSASLIVDGVDVVKQVHEVLDRMTAFCERVRSGEWRGHTGRPIRNVVNIGRLRSKGAMRKCSSSAWRPASISWNRSGPMASIVERPIAESIE